MCLLSLVHALRDAIGQKRVFHIRPPWLWVALSGLTARSSTHNYLSYRMAWWPYTIGSASHTVVGFAPTGDKFYLRPLSFSLFCIILFISISNHSPYAFPLFEPLCFPWLHVNYMYMYIYVAVSVNKHKFLFCKCVVHLSCLSWSHGRRDILLGFIFSLYVTKLPY